ncbi:winged helix-turn-helix domain-containing protein [Rheinheimera gaetbuli]
MTIKPDKPLQVGDWQYLPEQDKLVQFSADGKIAVTADLDNLSQKVANYFIVNAGRLVTKDELLADVWGIRDVSDGRVTRVIRVLRVALGDNTREPSYIETIPKRGYRFVAAVTEIKLPQQTEAEPALHSTDDNTAEQNIAQRRYILLASIATLMLTALLWLLWPDDAAEPQADAIPMLRYKPLTALDGLEYYHNVSPDERYMVYSYGRPESESIAVLMLEDLVANKRTQLTDESYSSLGAAFSPDGLSIAYQRMNIGEQCEIRQIELDLQSLQPVSDKLLTTCGLNSVSSRLSWSADGRYLVYPEMRDGEKQMTLSLLSLSSGSTEKLTVPPVSSFGDYSARFSRKGDKVAFLREAAGVSNIWVIDLGSRASELLTKITDAYPGNIDWDLKDEFIIYPSSTNTLSKVDLQGRSKTLVYTDINASEVQVTQSGSIVASVGHFSRINPRRISNELVNKEKFNEPVFSSNRNETLIEANPYAKGPLAVVSRRSGLPQVWLMYPDKRQIQLTNFSEQERIRSMVFSPDGSMLLVQLIQHILLYQFDGSVQKINGSDGAVIGTPSWSSDGKTIFFPEVSQGKWRIVATNSTDLNSREFIASEREFYMESYAGDYVFWRDSNSKKFFIQYANSQPTEIDFALPASQVMTKFNLKQRGIYFAKLVSDLNYGLFYYDLVTDSIVPVINELTVGRFSISADEQYIYILEYEFADMDIGILELPVGFL